MAFSMCKQEYDKKSIRDFVNQQIANKINKLADYLNFTLEATQEVKITSKYDSIREEMQEEIYHLDQQMFALKNMRKEMQKVLPYNTHKVQLGSLVITNKARFYISVSLGEFFYENTRFYAISTESPMYKIMAGKSPGDAFVLNRIH